MEVAGLIERLGKIISEGGPSPSDYKFINSAAFDLLDSSLETESQLNSVLEPILDINSMIGYTFQKPYGYAGDFELIHRIYTNWRTKDQRFKKWDDLYHWADSATAVRNRKQYFIDQVNQLEERNKLPLVLDLGSGPCTDIREYFVKSPRSEVKFHCVDMDEKAIEFGSVICDNYIDSISFIKQNVFKFKSDNKYDLIWSAGLFDYFNDKLFIRLINRYYNLLKSDGELIIGNFSVENPSRGLMEVLCKWYLNHRSEGQLIGLALAAGVHKDNIKVLSEATGINLFLHLKKNFHSDS